MLLRKNFFKAFQKSMSLFLSDTPQKPGLFGIEHSNRDFTQKETWGKNQFNSSFPAALAVYMYKKGLEVNYIQFDESNSISQKYLNVESLFGINPLSENIFFSFESPYMPYQNLVIGQLPRTDLVIQDKTTGICLAGFEIKLTALPDNSTCDLDCDKYSCEIVIRPDTIVYLACEIARNYQNNIEQLQNIIGSSFDNITNWSDPNEIIPWIPRIDEKIKEILLDNVSKQTPSLIQPVWKTEGKSPKLSEDCLDIFVWSNLAHAKFILDFAKSETLTESNKISRQARTAIWIFKMLYDFSRNGQINHKRTIDELSYNTKNDKAYSANGRVVFPYLSSVNLKTPRIKKREIKNIILGGGQNLLSPERRFDAIIYGSTEIFD